MLATEAPISQYFDLDGSPLDSGLIYFGQPNQNPETAPIAVYWDSAGTQPVAQPLRTMNGFTARNGTVAPVFASGDYSITVRTKKGRLVYYLPSAASASNAAMLQGDAGAAAVGYDGGTLRDIADAAKALQSYTALRAYTGRATAVRITSKYIAGQFARDDSDSTSLDNSGTVIVDGSGRRWKRQFVGPVSLLWFGADPTGSAYSDTAVDLALANCGGFLDSDEGTFRFASPHMVKSYTRIRTRGLKTLFIKDTDNTVDVTDPTTGVTTSDVNCLFYADPSYVTNPDHPSGVDAACHIYIDSARYRYTGTFAANSCFFFTTQLGRSRFSEIYAAGCDWAVWALVLYTTEIDRSLHRGCRIDTGTSLTIKDSGGSETISGGSSNVWKLNNVVYSVVQGCYGESNVTAFRLDNCALTMIGCGCEVMAPSGLIGQFIDFGDNNDVTVVDSVPMVQPTTATGAIVSFRGINNRIRFVGGKWNNNPGQSGVSDIYIQTAGNTVWTEEVTFYGGAQPIITCNGALSRGASNVFVRNGTTLTRYATNGVSSPLLASSQTFMDTSTADMIANRRVSGGGVYDAIADYWQANGTDKVFLKKLGTLGGSSISGAAAGGVDLLLDSGTGDFCIGTLGTGDTRIAGTNVAPAGDGAQNLGKSSRRWSTVYATTGTINTSDEREKQDICAIPDAVLDAWADVDWRAFKFRDSASDKGAAARWHSGLIAQRVVAAFAARGLDATQWGVLCYDEWPEVVDADGAVITAAGNRYGIRYEEALSLEAALTRRTLRRLLAQ